MMQWSEVLQRVRAEQTSGRDDVEVRGVQYDSRRVSAGDVFVAMHGAASDGNQYIDQAIRQGARAVITDSAAVFNALSQRQPELALAQVTHGRRALAEASATVFGDPQRALKLSAITGTNGKTTTAYLLDQLLASADRKTSLIGTIETRVAGVVRPSVHTTPESRDVLALFAEGVRFGCTEAVMEMSSHALEQERVWGLPVDVAIFTNLTQDHLDYHGTMATYAQAKAKLFAGVGTPPPRIAVINADSHYAAQMIESYTGTGSILRYGTTATADYRAERIQIAPGRTSFDFVTPSQTITMTSPLTGMVNVENLLAAMCAALARGLPLAQIQHAAASLRAAPGRFEVVAGSRGAGFTVVVDYAHTDDALENLIVLARELVQPQSGRVITVFGCGGDRDKTKRPKMGRAAGQGSDIVIVTSDNPRSEDPAAIMDEVLVGVRGTNAVCVVERDRRAAIALAIGMASVGDIVLLAGKGHEKTQTFAGGAVLFDDVAEAEQALREIGR